MTIICNATPLIAFARIGRLDLLRKVAGNIIIPEAVADEISNYDDRRSGAVALPQEAWISIAPVQSEQQVRLLLPMLDRGESEVIALALELRPRLVLMDELTGRKKVCGSVGLLIKAKQTGEIPAVKPLLDEMKKQGIYYGSRFIDAVLRTVDE